jgi:hypothetical protein
MRRAGSVAVVGAAWNLASGALVRTHPCFACEGELDPLGEDGRVGPCHGETADGLSGAVRVLEVDP